MQESLVNGRLDIAVLYNAQPSPEIDITLCKMKTCCWYKNAL
jgi:hypothetical protein